MTLAAPAFVVSALVSLGASLLLVTRLERLAERLGVSEALLGLVAALGANAPEITSAVTALIRHEHDIGVGVILGSNVFNLAALLGLGALVAGRIHLHRRVVLLAGSVALWIAGVGVGTTLRVFPAAIGVGIGFVVFLPLVFVSAVSPATLRKLPIPRRFSAWLRRALAEEEVELYPAIHPQPGGPPDAVLSGLALLIVVGASVIMERTASSLGTQLGLSSIVIGGVVLAAVTSLPNAVAAVYLASRGRGSAVLSEALNSNNLNILLGLLIPAALLEAVTADASGLLAAAWYAALTLGVLVMAYVRRGVGRVEGALIILGYAGFVAAAATR